VEGILYGTIGGVEKRAIRGKEREKGRKEKDEELEEVKDAIGRLKDRKALGMDGIPNEVRREGDEELGMGDM